MQRVANRHRRDIDFEVGEKVWLLTRNLPLRGSSSRKLSAIYAGPFEIIEQISPVAFRLAVPDAWKVHNVFHVSQLKQLVGTVEQEQAIDVADG